MAGRAARILKKNRLLISATNSFQHVRSPLALNLIVMRTTQSHEVLIIEWFATIAKRNDVMDLDLPSALSVPCQPAPTITGEHALSGCLECRGCDDPLIRVIVSHTTSTRWTARARAG